MFAIGLVFLFLCCFQVSYAIICNYYPNYPNYNIYYTTYCSSSCCSGYPRNSYDACCYSTYTSYSATSFWWISLIVVGVFLITSVIVTVVIYKCNARNRRLRLMGANNQVGNGFYTTNPVMVNPTVWSSTNPNVYNPNFSQQPYNSLSAPPPYQPQPFGQPVTNNPSSFSYNTNYNPAFTTNQPIIKY